MIYDIEIHLACINLNRAAFRLTALWGVSAATAASPFTAIDYFGKHFYGSNGVCLSLHIHEPYAKVCKSFPYQISPI